MYDSSGLLVRTQSAGSAGALVTAVSWSPQPYDPGKGPLQLEAAGWTYDFDGLDGSGAVLRNGVYLFVLESRQGGAGDSVKFQVTVVGEGGVGVILIAAPNPARAGSGSVSISWRPAGQAVELKIYDLNGGLVRDLGTSLSPAAWNLEGPGGARAADGIYLITARVPGQRSPQCFKFALLR